jgi:hypothetical protein
MNSRYVLDDDDLAQIVTVAALVRARCASSSSPMLRAPTGSPDVLAELHATVAAARTLPTFA